MTMRKMFIACAGVLLLACAETGPDPQGFNGAGGGSEQSGFGTADNGGEQGGFGQSGAGGPSSGLQSGGGGGACYDLCALSLTCYATGTVNVEFRYEPATTVNLDTLLADCASWCTCTVGRVSGLASYVSAIATHAYCDDGLTVPESTAKQLESMEDQFDFDAVIDAMELCAQTDGFTLWSLFDYDEASVGSVEVEFLP